MNLNEGFDLRDIRINTHQHNLNYSFLLFNLFHISIIPSSRKVIKIIRVVRLTPVSIDLVGITVKMGRTTTVVVVDENNDGCGPLCECTCYLVIFALFIGGVAMLFGTVLALYFGYLCTIVPIVYAGYLCFKAKMSK